MELLFAVFGGVIFGLMVCYINMNLTIRKKDMKIRELTAERDELRAKLGL